MLQASWKKNDKKAGFLIIAFSVLVFAAVTVLGRVKLNVNPGFDVHLFAKINAIINTIVAIFLIIALMAVKMKIYRLHRNIMLSAMILSIMFLLSYICHHLLAGETKFGDANYDGKVDEIEKAIAGNRRTIYYIILGTHVPLAGIILPFILWAAYRALTGEFDKHKKLARITWPVWLYVAVSGVLVYWMIRPYYQ